MSSFPDPDLDGWTSARAERAGGWDVQVLVSPDRCRAVVRLLPRTAWAEEPLGVGDLLRVADAAGIVSGPEFRRRASETLVQIREPIPIILPLAEGRPPRPPQDGRVEWHVRPTAGASITDDQRVDYYARSAIVQVRAGDRIATVHPPAAGAAGTDVFGRPIPVAAPAAPSLRRGAHVTATADGAGLEAAASGRLSVRDGLAAVETAIRIAEDVDFGIGNIDFIGDVVVEKSVLDQFRIRAGGSLTVHGSVGAAELEAGADIEVGGGISGRDQGSVQAGGTVRATYINSVQVRAERDVAVSAEILNARVHARGRIAASGIVGGEVVAREGVDTGQLGSPMHVPTSVVAAVDYVVEFRVRGLRDELGALTRDMASVSANVAPYLEDPGRIAHVPPHRLPQIETALRRLRDQKTRAAEIERELAAAEASDYDAPRRAVVIVRRMLFSGVAVRIGSCRKSFTRDVPGPLRLAADPTNETLRVDGLSSTELPREIR